MSVMVVLGGYVACLDELGRRLGTVGTTIWEMAVKYKSFVRLRVTESAMGPVHVATLEEVDTLEAQERALQSLYGELKKKRESESRLSALEGWVMEEAERLNEVALAEMEAEG